jgi:hypothetical protein
MKWLKLVVFAVGSYYILRFVVRLYNARKKMHQDAAKDREVVHPTNKKSIINPKAGEYTDYEELKD